MEEQTETKDVEGLVEGKPGETPLQDANMQLVSETPILPNGGSSRSNDTRCVDNASDTATAQSLDVRASGGGALYNRWGHWRWGH